MTAPPTHKGEKLPPEPAEDIAMPRKTITQPADVRAESPLTADVRRSLREYANGTDPGYLSHLNSHDRQVFNASDVLALLDALDATERLLDRYMVAFHPGEDPAAIRRFRDQMLNDR